MCYRTIRIIQCFDESTRAPVTLKHLSFIHAQIYFHNLIYLHFCENESDKCIKLFELKWYLFQKFTWQPKG